MGAQKYKRPEGAGEMTYTFEQVEGGLWQVRLNGEFVMFTTVKSAEFVDAELSEQGYPSREAFFQESVRQNLEGRL
jgi:hypothetical protein